MAASGCSFYGKSARPKTERNWIVTSRPHQEARKVGALIRFEPGEGLIARAGSTPAASAKRGRIKSNPLGCGPGEVGAIPALATRPVSLVA